MGRSSGGGGRVGRAIQSPVNTGKNALASLNPKQQALFKNLSGNIPTGGSASLNYLRYQSSQGKNINKTNLNALQKAGLISVSGSDVRLTALGESL